jgi:penicillin-binding protein-related factor A (putative recombinase)
MVIYILKTSYIYILNMIPLFVLIQKIENGKLIKSIRSINIELIEKDGFKLVYNKKFRLYIKGVDSMIRIR